MPLDAPIVAVLEEDTLLSAVWLVACSALSAYLDVELDKVHPRCVQIPAHQLPFPSLCKGQKNPRQLSGSSAFFSLVSSPHEHLALQMTVLLPVNPEKSELYSSAVSAVAVVPAPGHSHFISPSLTPRPRWENLENFLLYQRVLRKERNYSKHVQSLLWKSSNGRVMKKKSSSLRPWTWCMCVCSWAQVCLWI